MFLVLKLYRFENPLYVKVVKYLKYTIEQLHAKLVTNYCHFTYPNNNILTLKIQIVCNKLNHFRKKDTICLNL